MKRIKLILTAAIATQCMLPLAAEGDSEYTSTTMKCLGALTIGGAVGYGWSKWATQKDVDQHLNIAQDLYESATANKAGILYFFNKEYRNRMKREINNTDISQFLDYLPKTRLDMVTIVPTEKIDIEPIALARDIYLMLIARTYLKGRKGGHHRTLLTSPDMSIMINITFDAECCIDGKYYDFNRIDLFAISNGKYRLEGWVFNNNPDKEQIDSFAQSFYTRLLNQETLSDSRIVFTKEEIDSEK